MARFSINTAFITEYDNLTNQFILKINFDGLSPDGKKKYKYLSPKFNLILYFHKNS